MCHRQFALVLFILCILVNFGAAEPKPKTKETSKQPKLESAEAYVIRGIDWYKKGKYDKAIADFNEANGHG